jgi:gas vesicle protein
MMKFYFGLLVGLITGLIVGLLFAPQSGEDTRAQLSEQGISLANSSLGDEIRARANDALIQGREFYSRTKDELSTQYSRAKTGEL